MIATSPPIVASLVVVNKTDLTSDHFLDELPNAYVLSVFGNIFEFTSAPNTTLSVSASPIVIVPPLNVVVPVTVKLPPTDTSPDVFKEVIVGVAEANTFDISARNNSRPPAVDPSCTTAVFFVVLIVTSPTTPVNVLCWTVVPLRNCNCVGILY